MLYRKIKEKIEYRLQNSNKILIVDGARQVGKTFIIRVIGKKLYKNFHEINLLDDFNSYKVFEKIKNAQDFYLQLSSYFGRELGDKKDTIIFLDDIQVYPHILTMLKFLKDDDRFSYICSGSELGTTLNKTTSIPMGYIDILKMYTLDFEEFLYANGVGDDVVTNLKDSFNKKESISEALHIRIMNLFRKYLLVGGMPDAVNTFLENNNIQFVRDIHTEITNFYKDDATKYDKQNKLKIMRIYDSIPSLLSNKKKRIVIKNIENIKESIKYVHGLGSRISLSEYSPIPYTKDWQNLPTGLKQDPLTQNNTYFMTLNKDYDKLVKLKEFAKQLNKKLQP